MKHKTIMRVQPKHPKGKKGQKVAAQTTEGYLILDLWQDGKWTIRHAMDIETGEYGTCKIEGYEWTRENIVNAFGNYWNEPDEKTHPLSKEDKELIKACTGVYGYGDSYDRISHMESAYSRETRIQKEDRRVKRIQDMMATLPAPGVAIKNWIMEKATGDLHYAFLNKEKGEYHCTACEGNFSEKAAGAKLKHRGKTTCPLCGREVVIEKSRATITTKTRLFLIHNMDEKQGVERHFEVEIEWNNRKKVYLEETIRILLLRNDPKRVCRIYYEQYHRWDNGNPHNHRCRSGYLYPEGIAEGLKGTNYEPWAPVFPQMAAAGVKVNYNRLLVESNKYWVCTAEYLFKGRFYRLLDEATDYIDYGMGYYGGTLRPNKKTIEGVMQLNDRQKINRLRAANGGVRMLEWLQWSDRTGKKLSDEVLNWLEKSYISEYDYEHSRASTYLSPAKLMNYLSRQKAETESWKRWKAKTILETYEDYLSMASQLGKDLTDEMVYRPRELKRRHDELVKESELRATELAAKRDAERAKREAERMAEKYPGSEEILQEITEKYAFENEQYLIVVPKNFFEITMEGMALHHCVGHTERYFDRILQRETYICFLRKKEEPDKPFYTIEVEPGGTIRQHRGYLDEEPDIDLVKPFLREWQKVIRKRMSKQDYEYAKISAVKRELNIEELRQKNNTRVLEGLMEDLMEVI